MEERKKTDDSNGNFDDLFFPHVIINFYARTRSILLTHHFPLSTLSIPTYW